MKLNISERDKNLIIIILGILLVILAYFYGYQNFNQQREELETLNALLQEQCDLLQDLTNNRAEYEEKTEVYVEQAEEILATFPADLYEEDLLLYTDHLDKDDPDTFVSLISTPRRIGVTMEVPAREDLLVSSQDITGQIAANAYVPDGTIPDVETATLLVSDSSMSVQQMTYNGFKKLVTDIIGSRLDGQRRINNLQLSYTTASDEEGGTGAGLLTGTLDVGFYALSGFNRVYIKPEVEEAVIHGMDSIFGIQTLGGSTVPNERELTGVGIAEPGEGGAGTEGEGTGEETTEGTGAGAAEGAAEEAGEGAAEGGAEEEAEEGN